MDDNFSNFPEIIVQKLHSIFSKYSNFIFYKGAKVLLQVYFKIEK